MPHRSVISPTEHCFLANLPISCLPRSPPDLLSAYTLFGSSLPTILCCLSWTDALPKPDPFVVALTRSPARCSTREPASGHFTRRRPSSPNVCSEKESSEPTCRSLELAHGFAFMTASPPPPSFGGSPPRLFAAGEDRLRRPLQILPRGTRGRGTMRSMGEGARRVRFCLRAGRSNGQNPGEKTAPTHRSRG